MKKQILNGVVGVSLLASLQQLLGENLVLDVTFQVQSNENITIVSQLIDPDIETNQSLSKVTFSDFNLDSQGFSVGASSGTGSFGGDLTSQGMLIHGSGLSSLSTTLVGGGSGEIQFTMTASGFANRPSPGGLSIFILDSEGEVIASNGVIDEFLSMDLHLESPNLKTYSSADGNAATSISVPAAELKTIVDEIPAMKVGFRMDLDSLENDEVFLNIFDRAATVGARYKIEGSADLKNWTELELPYFDGGNVRLPIEEIIPNYDQYFFRVSPFSENPSPLLSGVSLFPQGFISVGEVVIGQTTSGSLTLLNRGGEVMTIQSATTTGRDAAIANVSDYPTSLAAGEVGSLVVQIAPSDTIPEFEVFINLVISSATGDASNLKIPIFGSSQ